MKDHKQLKSSREITLGSILGSLFPLLFLFAIFAAVGIVHVSARVLVMDAGYQLHKLETEHRRLTRENDKLKLELATLRSPSRLEKLAREKLGMAPPGVGAMITVESGKPPRMARASRPAGPASPLPRAGEGSL